MLSFRINNSLVSRRARNSSGTTLSALTLSADGVVENSASGVVVGGILGKTTGSTLSLLDSAGGRFTISGENLTTSTVATDYETQTTHPVTIRETLVGAVNSPRDTILTITVSNQFENPSLSALSLSSTTFTVGTPTSGSVTGATVGSTITASNLPTGLTVNGPARTWNYDGTGTATSGSLTLTETLADSSNSPRATNIGYTVNNASLWDVLVTNDTQLANEIASATGSPKTIALADSGTFTSMANINGKTAVTLRGETYGVPHLQAGVTATTSTNCKILGLKITRLAPSNTVSNNNGAVVEIGSSSGIEVAYCEISSNPLASIAMQDGSSGSSFFQGYRGIGGSSGSGVSNFNLHHNHVHDTYRGHSIISAAGAVGYIENNNIEDCYQNPCEMAGLAGSTIYFRHNDFIGTWAISTDPGSPHSSVLGFSAQAAWTPIVVGNKLIAGVDRRFAAHGSYAAASGPKFNDTTSPTNGMHYVNGVFAWNIVTAQDGIGLEVSLGNFSVFCNTILKDNLTASTLTPGLNHHDIGAGSYCCKNIFPNMGIGSHAGLVGGPNNMHSDWFTQSWDNIIMRPNGLAGTVTGDVNCYDFHFDGPTFTGWTTANIVGRVTPKSGSYFVGEAIGAVGTGYNWTTRSYSSFPTFVKPKTSNTVGSAPPLTQFDGVNDWLQMNVSAPFLDLANRRTLTVSFYASADNADTVDCYYSESSTTDFSIRRLPASSRNIVRFRYKNNAGAVIGEIESCGRDTRYAAGMGQRAADGVQLWTYSVNHTTGRYFLMCGKEIDPFPLVTTFKADDYANTRTAQAVMGQSDLSPPTGTGLVNGRLGLFYMTDQFVDLGVSSNHNNVVATDGTPVDWGSDGSGLTGTQPRGFIKGNAAAVNNAGGINLGSSPDKWIINGSVTDAVL